MKRARDFCQFVCQSLKLMVLIAVKWLQLLFFRAVFLSFPTFRFLFPIFLCFSLVESIQLFVGQNCRSLGFSLSLLCVCLAAMGLINLKRIIFIYLLWTNVFQVVGTPKLMVVYLLPLRRCHTLLQLGFIFLPMLSFSCPSPFFLLLTQIGEQSPYFSMLSSYLSLIALVHCLEERKKRRESNDCVAGWQMFDFITD